MLVQVRQKLPTCKDEPSRDPRAIGDTMRPKQQIIHLRFDVTLKVRFRRAGAFARGFVICRLAVELTAFNDVERILKLVEVLPRKRKWVLFGGHTAQPKLPFAKKAHYNSGITGTREVHCSRFNLLRITRCRNQDE